MSKDIINRIGREHLARLNLSPVRRNQLIIAGISTVLLVLLWSNRNFTGLMKFALPFLIISLWIPPIFVQTQHSRGVRSNFLIGFLGIVVASFVVRAIWLIGRE